MVDKYKKEMGQIIDRCKINSNKITKSAETYISNNFYSSQITKKKQDRQDKYFTNANIFYKKRDNLHKQIFQIFSMVAT